MTLSPAALRIAVRRDRDAGRLRRHRARMLLSICDLAERHNRNIPDLTKPVGFMGLGNLRAVLANPGDGRPDWFFVHEVLEITGATPEQWHQIHDEEIQECKEAGDGIPPRVDSYTMHQPDGSTHEVPVCNWQMALMLALDGPWGKELMSNVTPAFRRAMVETGIGDHIAVARLNDDGTVRQTGETLTEAILADGPLPSAEVAKHQAVAGPFAALYRNGGHA